MVEGTYPYPIGPLTLVESIMDEMRYDILSNGTAVYTNGDIEVEVDFRV